MNAQEYIDYLKDFAEKIDDETLKSVGIKSIAIIQEVLAKDPMKPKLLVKKLDETQYSVYGRDEILTELNRIFRDV